MPHIVAQYIGGPRDGMEVSIPMNKRHAVYSTCACREVLYVRRGECMVFEGYVRSSQSS